MLDMTATHARAALLALLSILAACGESAPAPAPQKAPVRTVVLEARVVETPVRIVAQTQANRRVEIRSRVAGTLVKQEYLPGQAVKQGQLLHEIDRRPFEAALSSAQAQLEQAQAKLVDADLAVSRKTSLVAADAAAQKELDDARSAQKNASAQVEIAEAGVRRAQLDLEYTRLVAPFDGKVGRNEKDPGALVDAGQNSLLCVVQETDPILVSFRVSENDMLRWRSGVRSGALSVPTVDEMRVAVETADGARHPEEGRISFRAVSIDPASGTGEVQARLDNKGDKLLPGQFVTAVLLGMSRPDCLTVPQRAVVVSAAGAVVYVVEGGKAVARPVRLGAWLDGEWIVESGLKAGEALVTDGVQRLRPGVEVDVSSAQPAPGK